MPLKKRILIIFFLFAVIDAFLIVLSPRSSGDAIQAAFDAEFFSRPDGYPGLIKHYGFKFRIPPLQMDPGLMYRALASGTVDVVDGFATDGRIPAYNLVTLYDDQGFFPPYHAAPLIREETLNAFPEIEDILGLIAERIDDSTMQRLNLQADEKGRKAYNIAKEFLTENGWLGTAVHPRVSEERIIVGGKHFTEQEIVGELIAILLETHLNIPVDRKLNMGGTMICFNALRSGDIDLYVEYTGTGLINILKRNVISNPNEVYTIVKDAFKREFQLVWLRPLGFNNTYTLTMKEEFTDELGITTISDLARIIREERSR